MKRTILGVVLLVGLIAVVCGENQESGLSGEFTYLLETTPPCTPIDSGERDPCEQVLYSDADLTSASAYYPEVPRFWELYYDPEEEPSVFTPHLVVRATYVPYTTRCEKYDRESPSFARPIPERLKFVVCFTDARIHDYLIGTGPPMLTVIAHRFPSADQPGDISEDLEISGYLVADFYEGREGILFLAPSDTTVVEAWWATEFWDLQHHDGDLKVIAPWKAGVESGRARGPEGPYPREDLARLDVTLEQFEKIIVKAASTRMTDTSGRIGRRTTLPMLITDANDLRSYYQHPGVGVDYDTNPPSLPPPAPG